jgi:Na+-translocating ferredoxin:NAD+ oxidoreductase RnfG subunit
MKKRVLFLALFALICAAANAIIYVDLNNNLRD